MAECRGVTPTVTTPKKSEPATANSTTTAKSCNEKWKADKTSIQASGKTKKEFIAECRSGSTTAAAPAKPAPTTSATPSHESKASTKPTTTPTTSSTPAAANQYSTEASARIHCPLDTIVWINLNSGIYHFNGKNDYGKTKRDAYMCEKDTSAAGFRAAKNEKHP